GASGSIASGGATSSAFAAAISEFVVPKSIAYAAGRNLSDMAGVSSAGPDLQSAASVRAYGASQDAANSDSPRAANGDLGSVGDERRHRLGAERARPRRAVDGGDVAVERRVDRAPRAPRRVLHAVLEGAAVLPARVAEIVLDDD